MSFKSKDWSVVEKRVISCRPVQPVTLAELRAALQEEWNRIPQLQINRLIHSMPRQCQAEQAVVKAQLSSQEDHIKGTQPTGTFDVKISNVVWGSIDLIFTFPYGIQKTHHPSPGNLYKGGTFKGRLSRYSDGELLCKMLKAAFRRGFLFTFGKEGKVVLDGVSLYDGLVYADGGGGTLDYNEYRHTLKAELSAKGITKADIDQTEELFETLTVDGR
ncbi:probable E3 ubiquitin-protein ligase DTX2 [Mya arenaria]|uniref:probable E3 ubiquitin-protein ligase DTX2 n=1 Tax=Mya arenaria TaxID=6604 RepID=UPI0022E35FA8|nr:probable E3 ubiquitin-protein ligase DTX2 [Mya arenaria]